MKRSNPPRAAQSGLLTFRSLREKLLTLVIALSLLPLAGMAAFSYYIGSKHITARTQMLLEKIAQDTADKIDLFLRQKKEEVLSMAETFPLLAGAGAALQGGRQVDSLLNAYSWRHDVYDLLMIVDTRGEIVALNTLDRYSGPLRHESVARVRRGSIFDYPPEKRLFHASIRGQSSQLDWYQSPIVGELYDYRNEDICWQYNIALSEPIMDPATRRVLGVWIAILNWSYIQQGILDNVEKDLGNLDLKTGYAFLFLKDADTIIGHKYRQNRSLEGAGPAATPNPGNLYATRLVEDHGLTDLHDAVLRHEGTFRYEFPKRTDKISGIAPIDDASFGWIVGVGIDAADIFRPIRNLTGWLVGLTAFLSVLVTFFTYALAKGITVPLKNLIHTSQAIARGNLEERVLIRSSDEVGILGATFNDMARALSGRESQLQDLNRNLENMVRQRTMELENSHDALKKAYLDLQSAQQQLVQSEKMASLGQLVAGIAHEIKNPLNFIYGNTGFLLDYTRKLQSLLEEYDRLPSFSAADRARMENVRREMNYDFIREDLPTLIDNFTEGARRINNIVSDLRTFSRLDTDEVTEIDVHASIEMSLNLLRNQYKGRIEVHRQFGDIPRIQGYSGKLNQVFMNLLSNAFHAIREQGDVWIRTRESAGAVEVEIEDSGSGIPKEHQNRIFEPFFTTKPVGQGTGLGLSISYGIVEQHHGRIHVRSTPGKGSVFTLRLPVEQESAEA